MFQGLWDVCFQNLLVCILVNVFLSNETATETKHDWSTSILNSWRCVFSGNSAPFLCEYTFAYCGKMFLTLWWGAEKDFLLCLFHEGAGSAALEHRHSRPCWIYNEMVLLLWLREQLLRGAQGCWCLGQGLRSQNISKLWNSADLCNNDCK